jgi:MoxR-like ATPase
MGKDRSALSYASRISLTDAPLSNGGPTHFDAPDRRDGRVYVFEPEQQLAVEVALVTGRPLLLRGKPGTGKSSFAGFLARNLGWRYYEHVVTARTQARDLLWTFDVVRRLGDAQMRRESGAELYDFDYVEPGVLWWAIDPNSAARRGVPALDRPPARPSADPEDVINRDRPHRDRAVVLMDEIDKADPDVPNNLLVALGSYQFRVEETNTAVPGRDGTGPDRSGAEVLPPLVVITTNEERELPLAFTRRCVVYRLEPPSAERLVEIAERHARSEGRTVRATERRLFLRIAQRVIELREQAGARNAPSPSTAEYLDAVRACRALKIDVGATAASERAAWELLERVVFLKHDSTGV